MDVIKCFRTKAEANRVAKQLPYKKIEILPHCGFLGFPQWLIKYNGDHYVLITNKVFKK